MTLKPRQLTVAGLTGSIGMGKSNAASALRHLGVPVHDADAAVHRLLGPGGRAVRKVAELFPEALRGDRIDRKVLGDKVFGDSAALRRLEAIVHPLVRESSRAFVLAAARRGERLVVLDIPLLYESRGEKTVDAVIVVSAPPQIQRQRVLARSGMTEEKFRSILARQVPDREKRRRADYVVRTGGHRGDTYRQLRRIVGEIKAGRGRRN
jgi:dephospho-CoA kinase